MHFDVYNIYTALPRQKDTAPLCLFQIHHLHTAAMYYFQLLLLLLLLFFMLILKQY